MTGSSTPGRDLRARTGTSVSGHRLVYLKIRKGIWDIWRYPGRSNVASRQEATRLIASSGFENNPVYSPDGQRIAFGSTRDGTFNIWVASFDGTDPVQLTDFDLASGTPRWSPDGEQIAFDSLAAGNLDVYVVGQDGGIPRQLTKEPGEDGTPSWSRDGRWIYFHSDRSGRMELWKIPVSGGPAVQVTRGGGYYGEESWDGRFVYYVKTEIDSSIWRLAVEGGKEAEVVSGPIHWMNWDVSQSGIYYATGQPGLRVYFFDFATGKTTQLLQRPASVLSHALKASPDEQWLLLGEAPSPEADVFLVENFR